MIRHISTTRRSVLGGIATGATVAVSGCTSGSETGHSDIDEDRSDDDDVFDDVFVEGTELVLEFTDESSVDRVNVIDPAGELFAERTIPTGVQRETIEIGTSYSPGEYEIVALEDEEEQAMRSLTIEPDVRITDLRLGRNHPEEMFEGAGEIDIETETIIGVKNTGTGPDEIVSLSFSGDVPRPTSSDFDESGIYDTESDIRRHADGVEILPGDEAVIYSQLMPFSAAGENIACTPSGQQGEFEVILESSLHGNTISSTYAVTYTGENLIECEIEVREES